MNSMKPLEEMTEEEAQRALVGERVAGPKVWRGRELAGLSGGLRDLRDKVVMPDDTGRFFDVCLLHLLAEAHDTDIERRRAKRRGLIVATDDVAGWRAEVSLIMDEMGDEDFAEARRIANEVLGIVAAAEVEIAGSKKKGGGEAGQSRTGKRSR